MKKKQKKLYLQKKKRSLAKIFGTFNKPRLSIFRSKKNIYSQLINDETGETLVSANNLNLLKNFSSIENDQFDGFPTTKSEKFSKEKISYFVGQKLAIRALKKNICTIIFDRNYQRYHGRIEKLAEGARKKGLIF